MVMEEMLSSLTGDMIPSTNVDWVTAECQALGIEVPKDELFVDKSHVQLFCDPVDCSLPGS